MAFWDWIEKIAAKQWQAEKDTFPVEITSSAVTNDIETMLTSIQGYIDDIEAAIGETVGTTGVLIAGSDGTNARAVKTAADGTVLIQTTGIGIQAAGEKTCSQSDQEIAASFNHLRVKNTDTTNRIILAIDESSTGASKPIYLDPGDTYDDDISGAKLHYSSIAGTPKFYYVLR